jgi:hypothetical protein
MLARGHLLGLAAVLMAAPLFAARAVADGDGSNTAVAGGPQLAQISGDPNQPRRHFRETNPADFSPEEADAHYRELIQRMDAGYRTTNDPVAADYRNWTRYNLGPYRSATHGQRFVNNYANPTARAYGKFEDAGQLPVGSIIAKDSFTATADGQLRPGPLFVMEKMQPGFKYVTNDWRYTMIMPDGVVFGVTEGENEARVEYCIGCHLAREAFDHLYFVPKNLRVKPTENGQ